MGLMLFSLFVAFILGGSLWLFIGDKLPFGREPKWDDRVNILAYSVVFFLLTLVIIFSLDF